MQFGQRAYRMRIRKRCFTWRATLTQVQRAGTYESLYVGKKSTGTTLLAAAQLLSK